MTARRVLAGVCALVTLAAVPVIRALEIDSGRDSSSLAENVAYLLIIGASMGVGWLLAHKRPDNIIGWLLLANGAVLLVSALVAAYAGFALDSDRFGARAAAVWETHGWPLLFAPIVAILFVIPDGRLPSPRWRKAAALGVVSFTLTLVGGIASHEPLDRPFQDVDPGALLPEAVAQSLQFGGLLGMIATLILAAASLVVRFRRAELEERQQLKWIALAGTLLPIAIIASSIEGQFIEGAGIVTDVSFALVMVAIPLAIGVAVLRYRLFDIDRLVSATVAYALITVLLGAAFVAIIVFGGVLLGRGSPIITAAATLAVAVAFRPLRSMVQARVERTFNPTRYRGLHRIDTFLADLRAGRVEPETIGAAIADAVQDDFLRLYYWLPEPQTHADADGIAVPELPIDPAGRTLVRRGDLRLGTVVHRDDPAVQRELDPVLVRAGLAVEIARLRVEVRRQLAEVERSRTRIVAAAMDERRRLERDLHDGAQQQLVSIGLDLRHLQSELGIGSPIQDQSGRLGAASRGGLPPSSGRSPTASGRRRSTPGWVLPSPSSPPRTPVLYGARRHQRPVRRRDRDGRRTSSSAKRMANAPQARVARAASTYTRPGSTARLVVTIVDDGTGGAVPQPGSRPGRHRQTGSPRCTGSPSVDSPPNGGTPRPGGAAMRVVVAEDQALLREGLARLFPRCRPRRRWPRHRMAASVRDVVADHTPDLVVVDIRMPPTFTDEGIPGRPLDS